MNNPRDRVRQQIVIILRAWGMADDLVNTNAAANKVGAYDSNSKKLPEDWVIDVLHATVRPRAPATRGE